MAFDWLRNRVKSNWEASQQRAKEEREKPWNVEYEQRLQEEKDKLKKWYEEQLEAKRKEMEREQPTGMVGSREYEYSKRQIADKEAAQAATQGEVGITQEETTPKTLSKEEIRKISLANPGKVIDSKTGEIMPAQREGGELTEYGKQQRYDIERIKAGGLSSKQIELEEQKQQKIQRLMQAAQAGLITQEEMQAIGGADIDWGQALGAGGVGVVPGLVGGVGTAIGAGLLGAAAGGKIGATVGSVGGVPGALALGAIGALGGFLIAMKGNLASQQRGEYTADKEILRKAQTALTGYITLVNQDPSQAPMAIEGFYTTLNAVDMAYVKTYRDSQEDLNRWLGNDGTPEIAKFMAFNNYLRPMYEQRFQAALGSPNSEQAALTEDDWAYIQDFMGEFEE